MNKKQKLTTFVLAMSLMTGSSALAYGKAPTSQFGFTGWPYRQNSYCYTPESNRPQQTDTPPAAATPVPEICPTASPETESTPAPAVTPSPTAAPLPDIRPTPAPTKPVVSTPPSTGEDYTTPSMSAQEENAFILLNQDRIANGLSPLTLDPALSQISRVKSRDMHEKNYFSHTSPTYGSVSNMLKHFGYSFTSVAENIAHHANVTKAQAAFMSSAGHRRNILGSQWSKVGIGVWTDSQGFVYVTQLFVR